MDTKNMLSALQEVAFSKSKNMNLELASICLCEYTKTLLKYNSIVDSNTYIKAILRNLQSDSSHPNPSKRYICIYNFQKLLEIVKNTRVALFKFAMTEIAPVCFKNVSQLIVATSHKTFAEKEIKTDAKPAIELTMLSKLIIENIEHLTNEVKAEVDRMDQEGDANTAAACISAYEEFSEYLLQNSFSSDHHCRYESQKVLHVLASKFFTVTSQLKEEDLPGWILNLIQKCNLVVNKRIDDSQLEILKDHAYDNTGEQSNIINHLTAQLQGINWLAWDMKVKLEQLINPDMLHNVIQGANMLDTSRNENSEPLAKKIVEDVSRKIIKSQYLKQLFELLSHCSRTEDLYESFVVELEKQTGFK